MANIFSLCPDGSYTVERDTAKNMTAKDAEKYQINTICDDIDPSIVNTRGDEKYGSRVCTDMGDEYLNGTIEYFECEKGLVCEVTFPDDNRKGYILLRDQENGDLYARIDLNDEVYDFLDN